MAHYLPTGARCQGDVDEAVVRAVLQGLDHEEASGADSWVTRP